MKWISVILILLCFVRCNTKDTRGNRDSLIVAASKANKVRDSLEIVQRQNEVTRKIDSLNTTIKRIANKCIVSFDEFKNITFYQHKSTGKNWPNRKTIYAECNSKGFYYLRSNYYSDDWLFHSRIQVKIGDQVIESEDIPSYSEGSRTENEGGNIWENVTYHELGQAIVAAIAKDPGQRVVVRFIGREYHHDETLTASSKNAIKDIYDLARTIGELEYYQTEFEKLPKDPT